MRLKKICIYEWGPKEFISPSVGFAYVVIFQSLVLLPLNVCVTPQCPGSGEYIQPVRQHCSPPVSAGPTSVKTFERLQQCMNFALMQETLFAFWNIISNRSWHENNVATTRLFSRIYNF